MVARVIKRGQPDMIIKDEPVEEKQVKVKVIDRWSVIHDGERHVEGDTVVVPESVAVEWERSRWVERVSSSKAD
jgi:hypothetical protein